MTNIKITIKLEKSKINNTVWLMYTYLDYNKTLKIYDFYPSYIRFTKDDNVYISEPCIVEDFLIDYLHDNNIVTTINIPDSDWRRFKLTPTGLLKLL
jgi:hypothetical protein